MRPPGSVYDRALKSRCKLRLEIRHLAANTSAIVAQLVAAAEMN